MSDGFRRWLNDMGLDTTEHILISKKYLEVKGVSPQELEELDQRNKNFKALIWFRDQLYKEYHKFCLTNCIFRNLTPLEMKAWKVLRSHYKKDCVDVPFQSVLEVNQWIIANHFLRGLALDFGDKGVPGDYCQRKWTVILDFRRMGVDKK